MKKFSMYALLVLGLFVTGCNPPKAAPKGGEAPPAESTKPEMPAEKPAETPAEKPAETPAEKPAEKPAEPETK